MPKDTKKIKEVKSDIRILKKLITDARKESAHQQRMVKIYQNKLRRTKNLLPKKRTRAEQRLEKAKKLYPIGTKFSSMFGANDVVTQRPKLWNEKPEIHYSDEGGDIYVTGEHENRMIYCHDTKRWATKYQ